MHRLCTLAVVLLALASSGCLADRLVLGENHERIDAGGATRRLVQMSDGKVECWIAPSPGARDREPAAFVLYFVGKDDRADRWIHNVATGWAEKSVEVWGMNYPASGGSDGPRRIARGGPAALAAYDAVRRAAGGRPIFLQAGRLGTTAALCLAAGAPGAGIIPQNPP